jgi:hypothetical protein
MAPTGQGRVIFEGLNAKEVHRAFGNYPDDWRAWKKCR